MYSLIQADVHFKYLLPKHKIFLRLLPKTKIIIILVIGNIFIILFYTFIQL